MGREIAVIGGGPAGLLTSLHIRGHDVVIYEEHRDVGIPKHCAGFVGEPTVRRIAEIVGWDVIDHSYNNIVFYTPRGKYELYFKNPLIYHVNRPLLEQKLLEKTLSLGHRIVFNKKAKPGSSLNEIRFNGETSSYDKIIVADGPYSLFRRKYFREYREYLIGVQYIYRARNIDQDTVHTLFNNYTPDFFQWLTPIDHDEVLIGFATKKYRFHPTTIVKHIVRKTGVELGGLKEVFGGAIPVDKPLDKPFIDNKLFFIGDSIPITKPYTGGGLFGISLLAPILGYSIDTGDYDLFTRTYSVHRSRINYEYFATMLARKIGYWIPPYFVAQMHRLGILDYSDYDNHYKLFLKSIPLAPYLIIKMVYS